MNIDGGSDKINISDSKQFVVFKIGEEEYGLDIQRVIEILEPSSITRVPHAPKFIKGVINLRGEVVPVMGLRERFGLPIIEDTEETRIIIFKVNDASIGAIVDGVAEVIYLASDAIEGVSNFSNDMALDFISGVGKLNERIITLINLDKLIDTAKKQG